MWLDVALTSFFQFSAPYLLLLKSSSLDTVDHTGQTNTHIENTRRKQNALTETKTLAENRKYSQKTYTFQGRTEIRYPAFGGSLTLFYYCFEHFHTFYQTFYSAKGRAAAPSAPLNPPLLSDTNTLSENTIHFHKTNSTLSRNGIHS